MISYTSVGYHPTRRCRLAVTFLLIPVIIYRLIISCLFVLNCDKFLYSYNSTSSSPSCFIYYVMICSRIYYGLGEDMITQPPRHPSYAYDGSSRTVVYDWVESVRNGSLFCNDGNDDELLKGGVVSNQWSPSMYYSYSLWNLLVKAESKSVDSRWINLLQAVTNSDSVTTLGVGCSNSASSTSCLLDDTTLHTGRTAAPYHTANVVKEGEERGGKQYHLFVAAAAAAEVTTTNNPTSELDSDSELTATTDTRHCSFSLSSSSIECSPTTTTTTANPLAVVQQYRGGEVVGGRYLLAERLHYVEQGPAVPHLSLPNPFESWSVTSAASGGPQLVALQSGARGRGAGDSIGGGRGGGDSGHVLFQTLQQQRMVLPHRSIGFKERLMLASPDGVCCNPLVYLGDLSYWMSLYNKSRQESYSLYTRLGKGAYGEVWRAICLDSVHCLYHDVVLKRMFVQAGGERVRLSGMREVFFGNLLKESADEGGHVSRFVTYFVEQYHNSSTTSIPAAQEQGMDEDKEGNKKIPSEPNRKASSFYDTEESFADSTKASGEREKSQTNNVAEADLWLVFAHEGYSLANHLFQPDPDKSGVLTQSPFWWTLKTHAMGTYLIQDIIRQILLALRLAHSLNIVHRDVKPENVFLSTGIPVTVRLGDWGSAIIDERKGTPSATGGDHERSTEQCHNDNDVGRRRMESLYGVDGPTKLEETEGYQPPEALFGDQASNYHRLPSYDMWGVGVILLQMILGTMDVFALRNKRKQSKV
eukprot:GHVQ01025125.1.p1 GENE.GHVQ01025125.1~~GHVQ01025125.1.p1  ORF type:complete len:758 (-),score=112.61 GHVQ01025125.1:1578-3851(-)